MASERGGILVEYALVAEVSVCELAVAVLQIEFNRASSPSRTTADLGHAIMKALRLVDAHTMLHAGDWDLDRFTTRLDDPGNVEAGSPRLDIDR